MRFNISGQPPNQGGSMTCHTAYTSPVGDLIAVAEDDHLTGFYGAERTPAEIGTLIGRRDNGVFSRLGEQLARYWEGAPVTFDIPLRPCGTLFQKLVWKALLDIPYGQTISYGELARRVGRPAAVRAVGRANGANPILIIIPCHRVIGGSGALTGYASGLEKKRTLLQLEGALDAVESEGPGRSRVRNL
jgi:methylated-DNA-[protein]-cysteine S-methyltransferase